MKRAFVQSAAAVAAVLTLILTGCNAFGLGEDDENEVRVTVTALAADNLTGNDGHIYRVNSQTEFEGAGLNSLADVQIGETVEIEWEAISGSADRLALEIESGDHDDSGDDDD